jgi:cytochrome c-type biogenesis protein CcmH/NrfG
MRRLVHVVWPLAMITIFVATFRRSAPRAATGDAVAPCDRRDGSHSADDAVERLERCLALDASDVESMIALGDVFAAASRVDRAEALYRRALEVEPHDARVHVRLGRLLLARGDAAGARREGEAALQSHVGNGAALRLIAEARAR